MSGAEIPTDTVGGTQTRQQRRQDARQAAKQVITSEEQESGVGQLRALRSLLIALQDDLDRSGMVDVVVAREDGPSVVLTLDKRFVSDQSLELLHTSRFTVVGKVTQLWPTDSDVVNLYRRSVLSLVPALGQTVTWGMLALLATLASSLDPAGAERAAYAAAGLDPTESDQATGEANGSNEKPEIMLGDVAVQALSPAVSGPAFQVLPLAICA